MSNLRLVAIATWAICAVCICHSTTAIAQPVQSNSTPDPALLQPLQSAQQLLGKNDFVGAEKLLRKTKEKFGNKPGLSYLLGYSLHAQKKYDEAFQAYQRASSTPRFASQANYNLACIHALRGEKDMAFASLDLAVKAGFKNFSHAQSDTDLDNIKTDPRFKKFATLWLADDQLFVEPTRIIHKWAGEAAGDQFGWTARRVGDLDEDGAIDFVATAPTHNKGAGKIYVYSSRSGKQIHAIEGQPGFRLGNSAVGIGDINSDNIPDFIAGAPGANGKGAAFVYSGSDGSVLTSVYGKTQGGQFGYEVSELGDVDGDSIPDFLVGEMSGNGKVNGTGRVIAYSGKTKQPLFEISGERKGDGFGNAAAATKDGRGNILLAVGAQNGGPNQRGRVYVYEIATTKPKLKFRIEGDQNSSNLGQMFLSFPGDLDRDQIPDVYASDFSDKTKAPGGGKVVVHSGADGRELLVIHGNTAGEGLGTSPSDAGDVDGDGIGDLVVGAWQNKEGAVSGGKVYLFSSANQGKLLRSWTCKQSGDTLGFDACGIGDVDGDGNIDFLLTSAWSNKDGQKTGRVFIVAGDDHRPVPSTNTPKSIPLFAGDVTTLIDNIDAGTGGINVDRAGNVYTADFGWRLDGGGKGGN